MLDSVLVANRGEIALRVVRACRDLGIRVVVAHSDVDADSPAVAAADAGVNIGPAAAAASYLDVEAVVAAALDHSVAAIHPGYGFLAENPALADAVTAAGLTFVGPSPATMRTLGDKRSAREAATGAGLPVLPAVTVDDAATIDTAAVEELGFPLLVKAAFGGGGRGMRRVDDAGALATTLDAARRESDAAFGRAEVYLERLVERPRHVEVQVLADHHGHVVHLGTRDCTLQRRHQKLVEEAPAPSLPAGTAEAMLSGAVELARNLGYRGAGTVEYLFDPASGEFFFLEVNTRLQVEHTVTEMVTGLDVVEAQLRIAAGEPLGLDQVDVDLHGHAIEVRILAEDPATGFLPATGHVTSLAVPSGPWVRVDSGIRVGSEVTTHYDSLLMKVCASGPDRERAISRIGRALGELRIGGLPTTAPFAAAAVTAATFAEMSHHTGSVDEGTFDDQTTASAGPAPTGLDVGAPASPTERLVAISTRYGDLEVAVPFVGSARAAPVSGPARRGRTAGAGGGRPAGAVAPMDATLVAYTVAPGDTVAAGDTVAVVESMKLETHVAAGRAGTVAALRFEPGELVRRGELLVDLVGGDGD